MNELVVLGALISSKCPDVVEHRLGKATSAFWAHSDLLMCQDVPIAERFKELRLRVWPVATHACASWVMSKTVVAQRIVWENVCVRRIFRILRHPGEEGPIFLSQRDQLPRAAFHSGGGHSLFKEILVR